MRKTYLSVTGLISVLMVTACTARFTHNSLKLPGIKALTRACGGDPAVMGVSPEASRNVLVLKDKIDTQNRLVIGCDGTELSHKPEPTRTFGRTVAITPPVEVYNVTAVEVSSQRTCGSVVVDRKAIPGTPSTIMNSLNEGGELRLLVSDDAGLQGQGVLLVEDGMNPITVRYLGANGKVLGQRQLILQIAVERKVIDGENQPRRVAECAPKR